MLYTLLIYLFTCVTNDTLNVTVEVFAGVLGVTSNDLLPMAAIGGFVGVVLSLIVGAAITLFFFKNYPEEAGAYPDNEPVDPEEQKKTLEFMNSYKSPWTVGKLLKTKEFWMLVLIFGFLFMGLVATMAQMIPRLGSLGVAPNLAILCLSIASIIGIPGSFAWGAIDQKIGTGKTNRIFCTCWAVTMIISAFGMAVASVPVTIVSIVLYSLLNGGLGNMMPSMFISVFGRFDFA